MDSYIRFFTVMEITGLSHGDHNGEVVVLLR